MGGVRNARCHCDFELGEDQENRVPGKGGLALLPPSPTMMLRKSRQLGQSGREEVEALSR